MTTKYGILSLGFCGFLGFIVGLFYYPQAVAARNAALASGDGAKVRLADLLILLSRWMLWGGLVLALVSVGCYLLYLKWERDHHDT
jgi:hypothetical protein